MFTVEGDKETWDERHDELNCPQIWNINNIQISPGADMVTSVRS